MQTPNTQSRVSGIAGRFTRMKPNRSSKKAEAYYLKFMKDMPDLGENMMAKNMLDWFTILAFYEASDHRMDGETLLEIKRRSVEKMKFLGKLIDGNKQKWPCCDYFITGNNE